MKAIIHKVLELIGLRKVIRFEQSSIYDLNESTSELEIRKILEESLYDSQFHIGIEHETSESDKCGVLLVQHHPTLQDFFLVCKTYPFDTTPWQKISIDVLVQLIFSTKKSECKKFEKWKLMKAAVEGKAFGEY